jgi:trimethylamine--corrinoid protein Co-methyltransferase
MVVRNQRSSYLRKEGFSLNMYTDDELQQIHLATLEVLWQEGVHVNSKQARDIYKNGGAIVDHSTAKVKIHPYMVEEAIKSAPSTVTMASRDGKHDYVMDGSRVGFTTFGAGITMIDPDTGEVRGSTKKDLELTALFGDYLDTVDIYSHAVTAKDAPACSVDLHEAEAFLNNTSKHCMHIDLANSENIKRYIDMGAAIVGGVDKLYERPIISALTCPQSPLQLHQESCDIIIQLGEVGLPVNVLSMAMSGATTPITLAGTLVVHNAEVLAGLVLSQLANKGAPIIYGSSTTSFDMQQASAPVGSPEMGMLNAGVVCLAQYYNLPSYVGGT